MHARAVLVGGEHFVGRPPLVEWLGALLRAGLLLARRPAPSDQAGVLDGAVQPGPEGARLPDAPRVPEGLQQRLLRRVVAVGGTPADGEAVAAGDPLGGGEQIVDRGGIPLPQPVENVGIPVGSNGCGCRARGHGFQCNQSGRVRISLL